MGGHGTAGRVVDEHRGAVAYYAPGRLACNQPCPRYDPLGRIYDVSVEFASDRYDANAATGYDANSAANSNDANLDADR